MPIPTRARTKRLNSHHQHQNRLLRLAASLCLAGLASIGTLQAAAPTTNGLFYGNGDNQRYPSTPYAVSDNGSRLYVTLIDTTLHVALVVDRSVNDNVFDCGSGGGPPCSNSNTVYMESAGWQESRSGFHLFNSEYAEFSLTVGTGANEETFTWRQGYAGLAGGGYDFTAANWVSDNTVSGGGGTQPPNLVSASSMSWNMNNYATRLAGGTNVWTMPGIADRANSWKSPWKGADGSPGEDPDTVIDAAEGYPASGQILWSPTYEWEWSMVYEWSIDLSQFAEVPVFVVAGSSHHSPAKYAPGGGAQDDPFPPPGPEGPDPLMDFGDLPAPYPTLLADDGARHAIDPNGTRLGSQLDSEADGQPHPQALGDDLAGINDEDGIEFLSPFVPGGRAKVSVTVGGDPGYLSAFIDFNGDGTLTQVNLHSATGPGAVTPGPLGDTHFPATGTYELIIDVPANATGVMPSLWRITNEAGQDGNSITGQASSGEVETYMVAQIQSRVWADSNEDGLQDPGEPGIDGVTVRLLNADGSPVLDGEDNPVTTVTADGGLYSFHGLPAGVAYRVEVEPPPMYLITLKDADGEGLDGPDNNDFDPATAQTDAFTLEPAEVNNTIDAGLLPRGAVTGNVFMDLNGNAIKDPGEPNLPNVDVLVTDALGNEQTVTTDMDGNYTAIVALGDATAAVDLEDPDIPVGSVLTTANAIQTLAVTASQTTTATDVGLQQRQPVMAFSEEASVSHVGTGATYFYTLTFSNTATSSTAASAYNVVMTSALPNINLPAGPDQVRQVSFMGGEIGAGYTGTITHEDGLVTITLNEPVPPGEGGTITLTVKTFDSLTGVSLLNFAQLFSENQEGDPMEVLDDQSSIDVNPLVVDLFSFTVVPDPKGPGVLVRWETGAEFGTVGFDVYRVHSHAAGKMAVTTRINEEMITAQGSPVMGAVYELRDPHPLTPGEPRGYLLKETEISGRVLQYGPAWYPVSAFQETSVEDWREY